MFNSHMSYMPLDTGHRSYQQPDVANKTECPE